MDSVLILKLSTSLTAPTSPFQAHSASRDDCCSFQPCDLHAKRSRLRNKEAKTRNSDQSNLGTQTLQIPCNFLLILTHRARNAHRARGDIWNMRGAQNIINAHFDAHRARGGFWPRVAALGLLVFGFKESDRFFLTSATALAAFLASITFKPGDGRIINFDESMIFRYDVSSKSWTF